MGWKINTQSVIYLLIIYFVKQYQIREQNKLKADTGTAIIKVKVAKMNHQVKVKIVGNSNKATTRHKYQGVSLIYDVL